jgi:mannose-1-phosphate guanylyltransferase
MTCPVSHRSRWCIVVADDHGPAFAPRMRAEQQAAPVQYSCLGESATLFQRAMHRALHIAPAANVLVTALEEFREWWEPGVWFLRPENRFICDNRAASLLTGAAALLSIASASPSSIVTILPARCYVAQEWILGAALERASAMLPGVREGVITLGMREIDEGIDEDYLVVTRATAGPGFSVLGFARSPARWVALHLRDRGALISSGIKVGYAGAFAAHISRHWPGVTLRLKKLVDAASASGAECEVPMGLQRAVPNAVLRSLRWNPPGLSQRVALVQGCGWSSLKTPRAVERLSSFQSVPRVWELSKHTAEGRKASAPWFG